MSNATIIAQYFYIADEPPRTWAVKFESVKDNIPFDKLTRLYIAFAWINGGLLTYKDMSNTPTDQQRIAALVGACRQKNPAAQIYISSGYDDGSMYIQAANNPSAFADSVVKFLRDNALDGYDMDWENGLQQGPLNDLLKAVRTALDAASAQYKKTYGLTLAVWQDTTGRGYDLPSISQTVDAINIMSYGTRLSLKDSVKSYADGGFPLAKMIGGIETESDYSAWGGTVDTLNSNGTIGTIAQKAGYAWQNGLAGMMAWRLDNDYVEKDPGPPPDKYTGPSTYKGAIQLYNCMPTPVFLFTATSPARYFYTNNRLGSPGSGWTAQGIEFYAFGANVRMSDGQAVLPIYQYSAPDPQRFCFGTSTILRPDWNNDQVTAFFAFGSQVPGTAPVYQYHTVLQDYMGRWNLAYSLNQNDPNLDGWTNDGPAFYAFDVSFNDTDMARMSGSPITQMVVRSGDVLNAIQATNGSYPMPQHGGNSGGLNTVTLDKGDCIVKVSGYTGTWFNSWNCVLQLTIKTQAGKTYGPFGTMANATSETPFEYVAGPGRAVLAFYGTTINVPLAGGSRTDVIASLGVSYQTGSNEKTSILSGG